MKTTVINIRNAPAGWETNPQYVYIGRGGRGHSGMYGNPHPVGTRCLVCSPPIQGKNIQPVIHSREETLSLYEAWLREEIKNPTYASHVKALYGKTLVCFCKPNPCHGDILAQVCNELNEDDGTRFGMFPKGDN